MGHWIYAPDYFRGRRGKEYLGGMIGCFCRYYSVLLSRTLQEAGQEERIWAFAKGGKHMSKMVRAAIRKQLECVYSTTSSSGITVLNFVDLDESRVQFYYDKDR